LESYAETSHKALKKACALYVHTISDKMQKVEGKYMKINDNQSRLGGGGEDGNEEDTSYEIKCPVCDSWISDEEGNMGECPHLLIFWNSFKGPEFIAKEIQDLLSEDMEVSEILEDDFIEKVRKKIGADVEVLEAESGLNQCLTSTPTLYAVVRST
jgi:hypothetical protein